MLWLNTKPPSGSGPTNLSNWRSSALAQHRQATSAGVAQRGCQRFDARGLGCKLGRIGGVAASLRHRAFAGCHLVKPLGVAGNQAGQVRFGRNGRGSNQGNTQNEKSLYH